MLTAAASLRAKPGTHGKSGHKQSNEVSGSMWRGPLQATVCWVRQPDVDKRRAGECLVLCTRALIYPWCDD